MTTRKQRPKFKPAQSTQRPQAPLPLRASNSTDIYGPLGLNGLPKPVIEARAQALTKALTKPHAHTPTAKQQTAARGLSLKARVQMLIEGSGGMTCEQVERALKHPHQSISARIHELEKADQIHSVRKVRGTRGRQQSVWIAGARPRSPAQAAAKITPAYFEIAYRRGGGQQWCLNPPALHKLIEAARALLRTDPNVSRPTRTLTPTFDLVRIG